MLKRVSVVIAIAASLVVLALEVAAETSAKPGGMAARSAQVDRGSPRFRRLDTNHDGKLSRLEALKSRQLTRHFDDIDTNHDGFITPDEKRAAWMALRAVHARQEGLAAAGNGALGAASRSAPAADANTAPQIQPR